MTDWFLRPVLHVTDIESSLRFYIDRLGFTCPWRSDGDGVAQVDRQGCGLILADTWPEKVGKGLVFISLNFEPEARDRRATRGVRGQGSPGQRGLVGILAPSST